MRRAVGSLFLIALAPVLRAQAPAAPAAGLQPDWDIRAILQEMSAHAMRLAPVLNEIDTKAWVAKGASETYAAQLESSKAQARALSEGAQALMNNPEKLSACLELYFRITGLEDMLRSLEDGIRRYQDPTLAQKLAGLSAENGANRNRFQSYIVSLSSQQEQECAVMDREAQRCRSVVATEPPAAARPSGSAARRKK